MQTKRSALVLALSALVLTSCVERSRELTSTERDQLSAFIGSEAPEPEHPLDVSFEDKILLLGYDVSAESWAPGATVTFTWYWKVERALDEGWRLFTHVEDRGNVRNMDGAGTVRELYEPGRWRAGEYIRDVQELTLPQDWGGPRATFFLGIWNGPHRLRVLRGPNDGDNRVRVLTIPTPRAAGAPAAPQREPQPALPSLDVTKVADGTIQLDGALDEAAWTGAAQTRAFVNTLNGSVAQPNTTARMLWDDENMYVAFEVADEFLKSEFRNHDDNLWEQDCVEVFVDPSGDGRNYFEMQVSPLGTVFDTRYDTRRRPQPHGHKDWQSGLRAQVVRRGTPNDGDADQGYTVEMAIPWSAFDHGASPATRPAAGDTWRINFYVMDTQEEGQRAAGWSPPRVGDFHVPARFGRVTFVDPTATRAVVPVPAAAAAAGIPTAAPLVRPGSAPRPGIQALPGSLNKQLRTRTREARAQVRRLEDDDRARPGEAVQGQPAQ